MSLLSLCLILSSAIAMGIPNLSFAQTPPQLETLQQQQQQLQQQQKTLSEQRNRLSNIEGAAKGYLNLLEENVELTSSQIENYEAQLQQSEIQLEKLEGELQKAKEIYTPKLNAMIARLRFLQRQSFLKQGWELFLHSEDLNEFLDRRTRLKFVYEADQKTLQALRTEADRIHAQKRQIEEQKNSISLLQQQLLAQKSEIEAQYNVQQQLISRLNQDQEALDAAYEQLAKDSEAIGELIRQRVMDKRPRSGTGQLIYPSKGKITSKFGWRKHPISGKTRLHNGIDLGATYGTPIHAADSGTIIFSGWYGGYGNTVIIDHGDGFTTLYAHASKLYVTEDSNIQQGETIAAIGSSGLSTGPHLHFEVRKNGKPVDPLDYL
ncbi:MAG: murein hydrolase activator EnvC family protein [Chroococcales cyanobacterium]